MKRFIWGCFLLLSFSALAQFKQVQLRPLFGKPTTIEQISTKKLVIVLAFGAECPILRKHIPTLNQINNDLKKESISFIAINAISSMSDEKVNGEKKEYQLEVDLYQDPNGDFLKSLNFKTFSEVALIDLEKNKILYQGAINNQFTFDGTKEKPTENYLIDAVALALKNKPIKIKKTKNFGCEITY